MRILSKLSSIFLPTYIIKKFTFDLFIIANPEIILRKANIVLVFHEIQFLLRAIEDDHDELKLGWT